MTGARGLTLVAFDLDGVLVDSNPCHARAFAELWDTIGVRNPPAYASIAGRPTGSIVREYTAELHPDEARIAAWVRAKQERARELLREVQAFPDAATVLAGLAQRGRRLALVTGTSRTTAELLLARFAWRDRFAVVITADEVAEGKPSPEGYRAAMDRIQAPAEATLVVEDSAAGLAAGVSAGAYTVSVRSGERVASERFLGALPDLVGLPGLLDA